MKGDENKIIEVSFSDNPIWHKMLEKALLSDAVFFFEVNLSKDICSEPIYKNEDISPIIPNPCSMGLVPPFKFSEVCEHVREYLIPKNIIQDVSFLDNPIQRLIEAYEKGKREFSLEYWVKNDEKTNIFLDQLYILEKNADGDVCALSALRDYSKVQAAFRQNYENEIENFASYDIVTKEYNYYKFKKILNEKSIPGMIVAIDIHSFKIINSVCGISKGDLVLKTIHEKLISVLDTEHNELCAHINADHFIMFFPTYDAELIIKKLETVTKVINDCSSELRVPSLNPYYGISEWHPGKKVELSNSEAVAAKHNAKELSDKNYTFFDRKDNIRLIKEKKIVDAFDDALKNGEFKIWFQPKYSPLTKRMVGAEALIRWQQSDGSMMPPINFIPVFEQNGMIRTLDEYVFTSVCLLQKKWQDEGKRIVPISVNVSRASLHSKEIVIRYKQIVDEVGIDAALIPIEITETAAVDNEKIKDITDNFYNYGFPLHMDDFGSGYSTLSSLNVLHFETLKLDKSLIDYIGNYGGDRVLEHIICLAKELGMHVTAEGVENESQERFLKHTGCDSIQGYFYSKPISQREFEEKLDNYCVIPINKTMDLVAEHVIEHRKSMMKTPLYAFLVNLTKNYINQDSGPCDIIFNNTNIESYDEGVKYAAENYVVDEDKKSYLQFMDREKLLMNFCGKEETRIFHYSRFLNKVPERMRLMLNMFKVQTSEEVWAYVTVTQM